MTGKFYCQWVLLVKMLDYVVIKKATTAKTGSTKAIAAFRTGTGADRSGTTLGSITSYGMKWAFITTHHFFHLKFVSMG